MVVYVEKWITDLRKIKQIMLVVWAMNKKEVANVNFNE